ncbi:MAG: DNA-3-methyladenine glycosylase [Candidatus Hinthialibacter antarcticus]|nr:DNA-3-methyladenine glycosylase [Candidatus Hinthialibacter antarcticus]
MPTKPTAPFDRKKAIAHLKKNDATLAGVIKQIGPCTLIENKRIGGFESLYRTIASQQLSKKASETIRGRVRVFLNGKKITPQNLLQINEQDMRSAGLSARKVEYIRHLAELVDNKELSFRKLNFMPDEEVIETLTKVRGLGRWSAEMYMIFTMNRPDVFPFDDIAILNAVKDLYEIPEKNARETIEAVSDVWRPYRSVAVWYLYAYVNIERGREK